MTVPELPSTKKELRKLLRTLDNAYTSCKDCGTKYGVYSVGCSSTWIEKCDVCGEEKPVTEARDYAYFFPTIHRIKKLLQLKDPLLNQ